MRVELAKLKAVFQKVQEIKEDKALYCLDPKRIPVSLDDLKWVVEQRYNIEITVKFVDFDGEYIRGVLERTKTTATILIRKNQTEVWQRFVVAKELSQVVIDEPEDWSIDVVGTVEGLVFDAVFKDIKDFPLAVQSERLATMAAAELMFPRELRTATRQQLDEGHTTLKRVALDFELPESVTGWVLSDRYEAFIKEILAS